MKTPALSARWTGKDDESLIWLASYPRSGNTFARILLANYFATGQEDFDINKLSDHLPSDTHPVLWQKFSEAFSAPATPQETWEARRKFFEYFRKSRDQKILPIMKTHSANATTYGVKGFDFRENDRIIYVIRHPLDVVLSYAEFVGKEIDPTIDEMCMSGAYTVASTVGALEVRGSWPEHVLSWISSPPCPLLFIQYEALRSNPVQALEAMLDFLGVPILEDCVRRTTEASQFDRLRSQEAARSFNEAPAARTPGAFFFRKGESLQWLRALSPEQAYRLADGCGEIMQRVGYAHPRDVAFGGRNAFLTT
jgi:hypothetical protein